MTDRPEALPAPLSAGPAGRTYQVRTYGCQMNVHDSERLSGLLEQAGYQALTEGKYADVVVFNTCAVRENADNKLYGNLGHLASVKAKNPGMQIAVGGCLAQKDRGEILRRAPWVDVVFGTHNVGSLPTLLERARHNDEAQLEILDSLEVFPSSLPAKRDSHYSGWVSISVGCNNTCTFCIVPSLRGKEADRRPGDVLAEVEMLVADGVLEVTLLGQNVNSYGAEFGDRAAFAKLLRSCGAIDGLERVRFTSPHPKDFTHDVIEAMAQTENVCHQLHMPLQSGSDRVLRAMPPLVPQRAVPEHPGRGAGGGCPTQPSPRTSSSASPVRPRTISRPRWMSSPHPSSPPPSPSSTHRGPVPPPRPCLTRCRAEVVTERFQRLMAVVDDASLAGNREQVGRVVEVLVAAGEGRKDEGRGTVVRPGQGRPAGALHSGRRDRPGDPARRRGDHHRDLRRPASPGGGQRSAQPPPDPRRGPLGDRERAHHPRGRARHAGARPAGPRCAAGVRLRRRLTFARLNRWGSATASARPELVQSTDDCGQGRKMTSARSREASTSSALRASDPVVARSRAASGDRRSGCAALPAAGRAAPRACPGTKSRWPGRVPPPMAACPATGNCPQ